jgi:hypothetical protein
MVRSLSPRQEHACDGACTSHDCASSSVLCQAHHSVETATHAACALCAPRSPDGSVYQVGDEGNMCWSVACDNGIQGACLNMETEGAFRKVVCQPAPVRSPTTKNVEIKDDATVGVWGGT